MAILITFILVGCSQEVEPPPLPVQPAKVMTVGEQYRLKRELPGIVRAAQRSELAFQVQGQIVVFDMKEGQQVAEGDVLGSLNNSDFKSTVNAATADRNKNQANFDRAEELIVGNFISRSDYDQIKAAFDISAARLETAEKALADTKLVAPFSGVVAKTYVQNFEDVQAKQPILSLQNPGELEIVVAISETLAVRRDTAGNLDLYARFDALEGRKFDLYVKEFAAKADPLTQTFEVVVGISNTDDTNILPGMTAIVSVSRTYTDEAQGPLVIPLVSIVSGKGGASSVWRVKADNTVQRQSVVTASLVGEDQVEVTGGLDIGDVIVTAGVSSLVDGKEINPISKVSY
jgi:multidrug efflux system membrane fusion protein